MEYREGNRELRMKFDEDEINYDRWRPGYPDELFQAVAEYAGLERGMRALEVGDRHWAGLPALFGGRLPGDRCGAGRKAGSLFPGQIPKFSNLEILQGDFLKCPLQGDSFALLYSATAFHWIPEEQGYPKALRLLKSGGTLAVWWNHPARHRNSRSCSRNSESVWEVRPRCQEISSGVYGRKCAPLAQRLKEMGFSGVESRLFTAAVPWVRRVLRTAEYLFRSSGDGGERQSRFDGGDSSAIMRFGGRLELRDTMDLYLARKP